MKYEEIISTKYKICDDVLYEVGKDKMVTIKSKDYNIFKKMWYVVTNNKEKYKDIFLDELGSEVFISIKNGKNTEEIANILKEKYGDKVNPIYDRLFEFLNQISKKYKFIERVWEYRNTRIQEYKNTRI